MIKKLALLSILNLALASIGFAEQLTISDPISQATSVTDVGAGNSGTVNVNFQAPLQQDTTVSLINEAGQIQYEVTVKAGESTATFTNVAPGAYSVSAPGIQVASLNAIGGDLTRAALAEGAGGATATGGTTGGAVAGGVAGGTVGGAAATGGTILGVSTTTAAVVGGAIVAGGVVVENENSNGSSSSEGASATATDDSSTTSTTDSTTTAAAPTTTTSSGGSGGGSSGGGGTSAS